MNAAISNESINLADFRLHLQGVLIERCKQQPRYSLRTFAKHMGMDPTALSKILSGKRRITVKMLVKLAQRLNLSPDEIAKFHPNYSVTIKTVETPEYTQLTNDQFQAMSTWYYLAILELTHIKGFKANSAWVAKKLGITPLEVNIAVETMQRLGFIELKANRWIDKFEHFTNIKADFTTVAMRRFQQQVLQKSMQALEELPIARRNHTAMTFCGNAQRIDQAKKKIQEFMRELTEFMQADQESDTVFQLSVSLFPLTKE